MKLILLPIGKSANGLLKLQPFSCDMHTGLNSTSYYMECLHLVYLATTMPSSAKAVKWPN